MLDCMPTPLLAGLWACLAAGLLPGCSEPAPEKAEFFVFGTLVEVAIAGSDPATTQSLFQQLQVMFQSMHRDWHAWEPGQLTAINQAFAAGEPIRADRDIITLVQQSQLLETASGGRFNPAIGHLVRLWGFHTSDYPIQAPVPAASRIAALVAAQPSSVDIQIEIDANQQGRLRSTNPAVQLDLGGIAKGYAADLAVELLRSEGVEGAIVNAGGDVRAYGTRDGQAWRIAVQNPLGGIIGIIETSGAEAVFTSGNYQRFGFDENGFRYAHILDPATGWPVNHVLSASVIADSGIVADAAATALVVAGLDDWREVAAGMHLDALLVTDESGKVYMTQAMHERIELSGEMAETVIILD